MQFRGEIAYFSFRPLLFLVFISFHLFVLLLGIARARRNQLRLRESAHYHTVSIARRFWFVNL